MRIEIVNTGAELLLGRTLNTHQQWLGEQLTDHGYTVTRQVTVADTGPAIQQAVQEALSRADGVITTGGLGPTSDDLTRECIATLLGVPLREDPDIKSRLLEFYEVRRRPLPARVLLQAQIPEGATVLVNEQGTAPGLILAVAAGRFQPRECWLAMLPGPPRELRPMFTRQLLPWLGQRDPAPRPFALRTLRCTGIGESQVEERVAEGLRPFLDAGVEVAYCARPGEVDVRLTGRGEPAASQVPSAAERVYEALGSFIYGEDDLELEHRIVALLRARQRTLAVAESCTGGQIAHRITDVPGASEVFQGGWITYSNEAKQAWLQVPAAALTDPGAVSEAVARAMAEGARRNAQTDYALGVTGIAGPGGGTDAKPVGTVFIALAGPVGTRVERRSNPWDRLTFKRVTSQQALDLLRQALEAESG